MGVPSGVEMEEDKTVERKRRQAWKLMKVIDAFDELEYIMDDVSSTKAHIVNQK